jgi:hypothetical protein
MGSKLFDLWMVNHLVLKRLVSSQRIKEKGRPECSGYEFNAVCGPKGCGCRVWTSERAKTSGRYASRRDNTDRSQARSAWECFPRKYRTVGYGVIGRRRFQRYFSWRCAPCPIGAHTCTNHTVPTGRLFGLALSQALRARLRSHRPSGTLHYSSLSRYDYPG